MASLKTLQTHSLLAVLLLMGGCSYSDPGEGSGTLRLMGQLFYNANGADQTAARFEVENNGTPLLDTSVVLTNTFTNEMFELSPANSHYLPGYQRYIQLSVTEGDNTLTTWLEGPNPFTVTHPMQAQTHPVTRDLSLHWKTPDGVRSDKVHIELENSQVQNTFAGDPEAFTIPAALLHPGKETLRVRRQTFIVPRGGAPGSLVGTTYTVRVEFTLQ